MIYVGLTRPSSCTVRKQTSASGRDRGAHAHVTPEATVVLRKRLDSVRSEKLVKLLTGKLTLAKIHWPNWKSHFAAILLRLLVLIRVVGYQLLSWLSSSEHVARQAHEWRTVWHRRSTWLKGYQRNLAMARTKSKAYLQFGFSSFGPTYQSCLRGRLLAGAVIRFSPLNINTNDLPFSELIRLRSNPNVLPERWVTLHSGHIFVTLLALCKKMRGALEGV